MARNPGERKNVMLLKDCSKGKLYIPGEEKYWNVRVDYTDDDKVTLYLEDYSGYGTEFGTRVDFYDDVIGVVMTDSEVRISRNPNFPEEPEEWMGSCRIRSIKKIVQRHLDVRANVSLELKFKSDKRPDFDGVIRNISAGGIYFTTKEGLEINEIISFSYTFRTLERPFNVQIIWAQNEEDGTNGYGCRFLELTRGAESAVRFYVYGQLREQAHAAERKAMEADQGSAAAADAAQDARDAENAQSDLEIVGDEDAADFGPKY